MRRGRKGTEARMGRKRSPKGHREGKERGARWEKPRVKALQAGGTTAGHRRRTAREGAGTSRKGRLTRKSGRRSSTGADDEGTNVRADETADRTKGAGQKEQAKKRANKKTREEGMGDVVIRTGGRGRRRRGREGGLGGGVRGGGGKATSPAPRRPHHRKSKPGQAEPEGRKRPQGVGGAGRSVKTPTGNKDTGVHCAQRTPQDRGPDIKSRTQGI